MGASTLQQRQQQKAIFLSHLHFRLLLALQVFCVRYWSRCIHCLSNNKGRPCPSLGHFQWVKSNRSVRKNRGRWIIPCVSELWVEMKKTGLTIQSKADFHNPIHKILLHLSNRLIEIELYRLSNPAIQSIHTIQQSLGNDQAGNTEKGNCRLTNEYSFFLFQIGHWYYEKIFCFKRNDLF